MARFIHFFVLSIRLQNYMTAVQTQDLGSTRVTLDQLRGFVGAALRYQTEDCYQGGVDDHQCQDEE